ncbi:DinB family protein [Spongiimicrobium sp. 3-5]|uniref:DinB family protein n=1 Tax=Spongiimicrobium sp. 3-5 TaxID=3332596 RepID=UPI003980385B
MKFELNDAISVLERTPATLQTLLQDLTMAWTHQNEGNDSWSPFDVLGHLIHGEKTDWMVRTEIILSDKPNKAFEPFDRFAQFQNSKGKTLTALLAEFKTLRTDNLSLLRSKNIAAKDLERTGVHPEFGPVTLSQLLSAWVVHDLGHIAQISRVMAKQYKEAVGPWPKYLTILNHTPSE